MDPGTTTRELLPHGNKGPTLTDSLVTYDFAKTLSGSPNISILRTQGLYSEQMRKCCERPSSQSPLLSESPPFMGLALGLEARPKTACPNSI